jgi:hypothetical protein
LTVRGATEVLMIRSIVVNMLPSLLILRCAELASDAVPLMI